MTKEEAVKITYEDVLNELESVKDSFTDEGYQMFLDLIRVKRMPAWLCMTELNFHVASKLMQDKKED